LNKDEAERYMHHWCEGEEEVGSGCVTSWS